MKRLFIITILFALVLAGMPLNAQQLDSRNRSVETVIADGLAQLPAKNAKKYQALVDIAGTGQRGMELLCGMLKPAAGNKNSKFEYAIDGVVSMVSHPDKADMRKGIHDGLVNGLLACTDDANRAFLLAQLNKIAVPADYELFLTLFKDPYLKEHAAAGLALLPGADEKLAALMAASTVPDAALARIAAHRHLKGVEPTLLAWAAATDDTPTLTAIYNALAVSGTDASLPVLKKAAAACGYGNDATGATEDYMRLLERLGNDRKALAEARSLTKAPMPGAVRCAGLRILLLADAANARKYVLDALKDKHIDYRNTALDFAPADEALYAAVASKFKALSPDAKVDVAHWLGNRHVASQVPVLAEYASSADAAVADASIAALSKIGGAQAMEALLGLFGTPREESAVHALLSFNGDISAALTAMLMSDDAKVLAPALKLVSARRVYGAYPKVLSLAAAGNADALGALAGVSRPDNFDELCAMLEKAAATEAVASLQKAAKSAVAALDADAQYTLIEPKLTSSAVTSLYYPLLAQAGSSEAIARLLKDYENSHNAAAFDALLLVDRPDEMLDVLYGLALRTPKERTRVLNRYIDQIAAAALPPADNYRHYSRALALEPDPDVQVRLVEALAASPELPSLMLAAKYLDKDATSFAAATAIKTILGKNEAMRRGKAVKDMLEKSRGIFLTRKAQGDADAGYAVDEIGGMLAALDADGGFAVAAPDAAVADLCLGDDVENFDLYFDWNATAPATLWLRSMPLVTLVPGKGISVGDVTVPVADGWNNIHAKMLNDRLFVYVNGHDVAVNQIIATAPDGKVAPVSGAIRLVKDGDADVDVRNVYLNVLPETPIFTLSDEEAAQGFEVLFDGRSLDKWHGNTSAYVPSDGNIYVTAQYGGQGNLYTKKNYSDFIFRFDFYFDVPAVNNGVGIRTGRDVTGVDAAYQGMEIQILDHDDAVYQGKPYGYVGLRPYQDHGGVYGIAIPEHVDFGPIRQWHSEEIKAVGDRITVTVDGKIILDTDIREACQGHNVAPDGGRINPYTLDHKNHPGLFNKEGYISFCGHGAGVMFRNVRVLDLAKQSKKAKKAKK